jgi:hypothetical protein
VNAAFTGRIGEKNNSGAGCRRNGDRMSHQRFVECIRRRWRSRAAWRSRNNTHRGGAIPRHLGAGAAARPAGRAGRGEFHVRTPPRVNLEADKVLGGLGDRKQSRPRATRARRPLDGPSRTQDPPCLSRLSTPREARPPTTTRRKALMSVCLLVQAAGGWRERHMPS